MVLWYNLLDVATLNVYTIFMPKNPNFMGGVNSTRRLFIKELVKELVMPHMQRRMEGCCNLPKVITEAMERCGVIKESHATTTQSTQGETR